MKKAMCDGLRLAYAGGTSNLLSHLESVQLITRMLCLQKLQLKEASYLYLIPGIQLLVC